VVSMYYAILFSYLWLASNVKIARHWEEFTKGTIRYSSLRSGTNNIREISRLPHLDA
jgi:hypothetical protein